ncbi:fimbrial protein [Pseudomonas sp. FP453]|uniref:fimbrial protein n=1 Tax=Pseudomonas sp. FP453 TaxID=2954094 RepID=UPI002734FDA6|nr:fimbrial protein [Pseudomonas sp. FP453]WLH92828.1 fimbrial protein [Pseudomonas sp. FP453]
MTAAVTISFTYSSTSSAAICVFTTGKEFIANYASAPVALTIPRDAPVGTVVYEESVSVPPQGFSCPSSSPFIFALNPTLGSVTTGNTFPLGKTGLSIKVKNSLNGYLTAERMLKGSYLDVARTYTLEIIKSSEIASQQKVAAGNLGSHRYGDLDLVKINLVNPLILNASSCQTPDVSVQMGDDYYMYEFSNSGDAPRTIKFNIGLHQCQTGIQKVTYSLKATSQVIDQQQGIVALNASSTAKGIGLKLMNDAGQPIVLGETYQFTGFNTTSTNFNIPLSAAYQRLTDSTLEAGSANVSVTFIVSYL